MAWWGKLVGGTLGFMIGGPIGALIGAALGHNVDRGVEQVGGHERLHGPGARGFTGQERAQAAFFTATFSVMGHLAKADGRVTPDEIALAGQVMDQLGLDAAHRRVAQRLFNEGKAPAFPLDDVLEQLRRECRQSRNLVRVFVEIQLHAAYADRRMHPEERRLLAHVCQSLGFGASEFEALESMVRASAGFSGGTSAPSLEDAYGVLGVSPDASDAEMKRAYRRLMSQHHPDKLVSKGLPEEMMRVAKEKTQEIKAAYDRVKEARGT